MASSNDKSDEMIFKFSGDDDVWIFIDDVLVADLGGLHNALDLSINFATGYVEIKGEENEKTFADNTIHTLKMFYLERGHLSSNLSLSFNIQPLPSPPSNNEDINETEEDTSDSDTVANAFLLFFSYVLLYHVVLTIAKSVLQNNHKLN